MSPSLGSFPIPSLPFEVDGEEQVSLILSLLSSVVLS